MPLQHIKYLGPNTIIGVWHLTEDESFFYSYIDQLVANRDNLKSISHKKRRTEWLAGRYLSMVLAQQMNLPFKGIWTDEHNKPHLTKRNAHISLSHATPYVVVILDTYKYCGIDIERFKDKLKPLAPKFLNANELESAGDNLVNLTILWGAKEALYKLHGRRSLLFKDHIDIDLGNERAERFQFTGRLDTEDEHEAFDMVACRFDNYVIVYTV
ncbi:MAG: 4'-phosphopantetheinyl transferase superfamily protein [Bacteroidota bacterium]